MHTKHGFTLLEMSVVLLVIGLIMGGIVTTSTMIRNAQLQSVMGEYQMYVIALKNFKNKYQALPGDMPTAATMWSGATNGNGNGYIEIMPAAPYEHLYAWQELGLAGFVSGSYDGVAAPVPARQCTISRGKNIPASRLKGAGWNIGISYVGVDYSSELTNATNFFPNDPIIDPATMTAFWLGGPFQSNGGSGFCTGMHTQTPVMNGLEAWALDAKSDDGNVASGKIRGQFSNTTYSSTCNGGTAGTGNYNTTPAILGNNCALAFIVEP